MAVEPPLSLQELLTSADLLGYHDALKNVLKLRHAGDIGDTDNADLDEIGMSRPEQRRLWREYGKYYPPKTEAKKKGKKGFGKMIRRKVFGGGGEGKERVQEGETDQQQNGGGGAGEGKQQQQQKHIIPTDRITLCKQIGSGEFGEVFQAAWRNGAAAGNVQTVQVAVKRILPEKLISQHSSFLQEAAIMTRMHHEHVIRLHGVVLDTKAVMLVSELAPCGSLLECLQCPSWREPFSVLTLCDFALQIGQGMRYLSSNRLIHRDLAARNVLVSTPTRVKISDFGLSRSLGHGEDYYRSEFSPTMKLPIAWCAPECINFLRFTTASDVWSYGVCLWEMFSYGRIPWEGLTGSQILHSIDTQRKKLACPEACSREMYYLLMLKCWEWEPDRRPNFEQICDQIPTLMPPLLVTVTESGRIVRSGQLHYGRDEMIVLLDKSPPNGQPGFWLGASKASKVGLFRAEDTIAYLGAENPSSMMREEEKEESEKERRRKKKEREREEKRAKEREEKESKKEREGGKKRSIIGRVISQPQGDLKHTLHVGLDGRSFGLINVDKHETVGAVQPQLSPLSSIMAEQNQNQLPRVQISPGNPTIIPAMMSTSMLSLAPPRPPKRVNSKMAGEDVMSRSICMGQTSLTSPEDQSPSSAEYLNTSTSSSPPTLPPKPPRFRPFANFSSADPPSPSAPIPSTPSSASSTLQAHPSSTPLHRHPSKNAEKSTSPFPLEPNEKATTIKKEETCGQSRMMPEMEELIGLGRKTRRKKEAEEEEDNEELLRPASICCDRSKENALLEKQRNVADEKEEEEEDKEEEERVLQILTELQRDLTDFSLTSLDDCSEERALLDGEQRRAKALDHLAKRKKRERDESLERHGISTDQKSSVLGMDREEYERRTEAERKRMAKRLAEESCGSAKRASVVSLLQKRMKEKDDGGEKKASMEGEADKDKEESQKNDDVPLPRSNKQPLANWSSEAHEAYKLLVQCGHLLKDTSPAILPTISPNGMRTPGPKKVNGRVSESLELPKKIDYINSSLVGWEGSSSECNTNPKNNGMEVKQNGELCEQKQINGGEKRLRNGGKPIAQNRRMVPPPVPPKPKIKFNPIAECEIIEADG